MCALRDPLAVALLTRVESINSKGAESVTSEHVSELLHLFTQYLIYKSDCGAENGGRGCGQTVCTSYSCEDYRKDLDNLCALSLQIVLTPDISEAEVAIRLSNRIMATVSRNRSRERIS